MNVISQEEINNIRSNVDIVDIISNYVPLTSRGKNYFGVCPFHDDNNPSMSVSKEKQIYTCFSCGATGNVFKFLMDYENISFLESVKILADKASISINIGSFKKTSSNNKLYDIYDIACKFYQNNINTKNGIEAKKYLNNRDINENIIKEFEIGLAITDRTLLSKLLLKKGYDDNNIMKSGLVLKNTYGYNDMYVNRIMFPLYDLTGKVIGFSGRIYHGEDESKYINTKETEIFKKGELLYNYHRAKDEARLKNQVIIMEGFMDVIRAYTIGVTNVVASMGTAITNKHAILLRKMAKEIILLFDGDNAGAKATLSCINELEKVGVTPKIVRLEENLDPDEYIKKYGGDKFKDKLNNPINVMDFKLSYYKKTKDLTDSKDMAAYIDNIINDLTKIDDELLKEITLKKISEESHLDIDFLRNRLANSTSKVYKAPIIQKQDRKYNKYEKAEQNLIYYMLKDSNVIKMYNNKITRMSNKIYQELGTEISLFYNKYGYINDADLITFLNDKNDLVKELGFINSLELKDNYTINELDDYFKTIREYNINEETKRLKSKIKEATTTQEKLKYAGMIAELKKENI